MKKTTLKYIFSSLVLVLFLALLTGCYANGEGKNIATADIADNISNEFSLDSMAANSSSKALKRFYGLNLADYSSVTLYTPLSSMDVEELMIIKVENENQIDAVEAAVENRVSKQLESFSGYGVEQVAMLDDYVFKIKGEYIFYCVGENAELMKDIFIKSFK